MQRRHFNTGLALALGFALDRAIGQKILGPEPDAWRAIEKNSQGRLGVAVLDTATGRTEGHRLDERFPMCSTFKWLLASAVLQRVADGQERLDRRIVYGPDALLEYAPTTAKHVGGDGMSVAELCEAAVTLSDNTAANLLVASVGGPAAVTREARRLGDAVTRLDRIEPALNVVLAGDLRDTTTPRAMGIALRSAGLGNGLSDSGRAQLVAWMSATRTGLDRLRAGIPADWRGADKTGSWGGARHGNVANDVAILWPPQRAPLVVTAFLADCDAPGAHRDSTLAEIARTVVARVQATPGGLKKAQ
jgi:beta-lactamase class A